MPVLRLAPTVGILNAMTIYPGDPFVPTVVDGQTELVAELYRKEGFIAPDVVVGAWEDPDDGNYLLFVNIDKGDYYSLGQVVFKGNRNFGDDVLKWRLKSWRKAEWGRAAGRFKQAVFKKDISDTSQDRLKGPVNNYLMLSRHHRSG